MERADVPLGQPPLRVWELNENSTRYDHMIAAPSDGQLHFMWILWSVIFSLIAVYVGFIFLAIVLNQRVRKSPYNCYLIFLMIPDLIFTGFCSISCILNVAAGHYYSPSACRWQTFYIIWGVSANAWLNSVVAREVRKMLRSSFDRKRYFPPSRWKVAVQSVCVYLYCAFVSAWAILPFMDWLPQEAHSMAGLVCVPVEYDRASTLFFWLAFVPLFIGIPLCYVGFVVWDVLYHKLLPPRGKRRVIGVYFFRICVVFVVMWIPTVLVFYVLSRLDPWAVWASAVWSHFQGFVSSTVSLLKPDVARAVKDFFYCRACSAQGDTYDVSDSFRSSYWGSRSMHYARRFSFRRNTPSRNEQVSEDEKKSGEDDFYDDVPRQSQESYQFLDETEAMHLERHSFADHSDDEEEGRIGGDEEKEEITEAHSLEPTDCVLRSDDVLRSVQSSDAQQTRCVPRCVHFTDSVVSCDDRSSPVQSSDDALRPDR